MKKLTYKHTIYACFIGYIVQAIVNNFVPLLFLTFHTTYGIPLSKITFLVTFNFALQMLIDAVSAGFIDKIGYRAAAMLAHIFAATGFILLTILPSVMSDPFAGIMISVLVYAVGGGLLEVLISPIVEACPTDNKEMAMSMLHSFYCWGHVAVVLLSTIFFSIVGIEHWKMMALIWAVVPILNIFLFAKVPVNHLIAEDEQGLGIFDLIKMRSFWILMLLMVCAGASEQAVSQWASTFAELGLGVSKTVGDLAGPMLFAIFMGISRAIYGKFGEKIKLEHFMVYSAVLCVGSYLLISFSPSPVLGLVGCGICGLSVGIMWPGTFSMAAAGIKNGGTLMFALFALAGDVGCSGGPTVVGMVSSALGDDLNKGILAGIIFPMLLLVGIILNHLEKNKRQLKNRSGEA